jgi:hypothetical protein
MAINLQVFDIFTDICTHAEMVRYAIQWIRLIATVNERLLLILSFESRDSSVGIALGYGLDNRGSRVRFLVGAGNYSLHHRLQNGSGAHPASYPMGNWSYISTPE